MESDIPLTDIELGVARGELIIMQRMSTKALAKASIHIPTLINGTARLFATIAALKNELAEWKEWGNAQMNDAVEAVTLMRKAEERVAELEAALKNEMCIRHQHGLALDKDCFSPLRGSDSRCARMCGLLWRKIND